MLRDLVGETLGNRYHLVARIAGGGMGEVYRAHDMLLDRAVALKILQPTLASDPDLVQRFKQEARAAARLTHPNVVAVYDWGSEDERTYYMVMEFVPGTDLRDVLVARGALPPGQAAGIVASVCDALDAAHATGLVHRDVKPENVLIARNGTVKVADFGIAAVADADRTAPGGVVPGTLRYLAPEQAAGEQATAASDIWAAGAILGELVTGMPPALGSGAELLRSRANAAPRPPSELDGRVPMAIDDVVMTACAVDPGARYPSAGAMAEALRRVSNELPDEIHVDDLVGEVTGDIRLPDLEPTTFGRRDRHQRHSKTRRVAIALVVALIALGLGRGAWTVFGPQDVAVPQLVGLTLPGAEAAAADTGLEIDISDRARAPGTSEGEVLVQRPAGGVLREGAAVELVISAGPPLIAVPDLEDLPLPIAKVRLASRQLEVGDVDTRFSTEPEGTVISQSAADRQLEWGSELNLVVSRGPRDVAVPDVTRMPIKEARAVLEAAGFKVAVVDVYSNGVAAGKVVYTNPAGGAQAPEGSEIEVAKSVGPRYAKVKVPDVRNMTMGAARSQLEDLGLRVWIRWVGEECDNGTVADTDPLPGTVVRENDRIALFIVC
ncbi:MAG: PASTA domain-containing protein [Actinomycetota bacterium]|nr:PASTA domain-containing protein [Actinomycetota bacterium]